MTREDLYKIIYIQGVGLHSLRVHAFLCVSAAWKVIAGPTL